MSSMMLVSFTLKYGLYAILATSFGKVKHVYGMLRCVRAFRIWVLLHASGFRVIMPNFNACQSCLCSDRKHAKYLVFKGSGKKKK
jgi:hypothetical protein